MLMLVKQRTYSWQPRRCRMTPHPSISSAKRRCGPLSPQEPGSLRLQL